MYSDERIISRFNKLVGRLPKIEEIKALKNSEEVLSKAIAKIAGIAVPTPLVASGAHCKSCGPDYD
jgi:hypothetical protein